MHGTLPKPPAAWTPEDDATLLRLRAQGRTSAEIARELGRTRNAICGRAKRIGAATPAKPPAQPRKARKSRAKPVEQRIAHSAIELRRAKRGFGPLPDSRPVSLVNVRSYHCRWPIDGEDFRFCGAVQAEGRTSYCAAHTAMAWRRG